MAEGFTVLIASGDARLRARLARVLLAEPGVANAAEAADLYETIETALEANPDIVLLDSLLGGAGTCGLMSVIESRFSPPPPIIVIDSLDRRKRAQPPPSEAEEHLSRNASNGELLRSFRMAVARRSESPNAHGATHASAMAPDAVQQEGMDSKLSGREGQIFRLLGNGLNSREISVCLSLGESTVKTYIARLREKLSVKSHDALVAYAASELAVKRKQTNGGWGLLHEQLSKAFYLSPVGMVISDLSDGNVLDVNQDFLATTGLRRESLIGRPVADVGIVVDADVRGLMVKELERTGEFKGREYSLLSMDGEVKTVRLDARLITVGGDKRVLSVLADVTDRSLAAHSLKASERRYRMLFESIPEPICLLSMAFEGSRPRDCMIADVNRAFEGMMNSARDRMIGRRGNCVISGFKSSWLEVFSTVSLTGETTRLADYFEISGNKYEMFAFSPHAGNCAVMFLPAQ